MKVMFFGLGNMGFRMFNKIKDSDMFDEFLLIDKNIDSIIKFKSSKFKKFKSIDDIDKSSIDSVDVCILAFKPQQLQELCENLKPLKNALFISILAGVECSVFLSKISENLKIIRLMPNIMIETQSSVLSGFYKNIDKKDFDLSNKICSFFGKIFWLKSENLMHAATLLTGSSPAYIALFIESFVCGAEKFGIDKKEGLDMFFRTITSFVEYSKQTQISMTDLIENVSSKNGVTEAGMEDISMISKIIESGFDKGVSRSEELNSINAC